MSVEASIIDTRPALVTILLAGGVTGPLTLMGIGTLVAGMSGIRVDTFTELFTTVVAVLEFIPKRESLKVSLRFCWTAFRWLIATILDCRALQTWMPSCHVC